MFSKSALVTAAHSPRQLRSVRAESDLTTHEPLVLQNQVIVADATGKLSAWRLEDGAPQWSTIFQHLKAPITAVGGDAEILYVGTPARNSFWGQSQQTGAQEENRSDGGGQGRHSGTYLLRFIATLCVRARSDFERNASFCAVQGRYIENVFLSVLGRTYRAYQSDRCLVFCYRSTRLIFFHGGNTGFNVGNSSANQQMRGIRIAV